MATKSQKVKLGIFLTVSGVLFAATLAIFAGLQLLDEQTYYYVLFGESVSGLELGSQVKYSGVRVGTVEEVEVFEENLEQIRVTIALVEDTPVRTDTRAVLRYQGITGLKFIELQGGTEEADPLPPRSYIPAEQGVMAQLTDRADDISRKVDQILDNLLIITGPENQARIASALATFDEMVVSVNTLSRELAQAAATMNALLQKNDEPLTNTIRNVSETTERMEETIGNANVLLVELRQAVEGVDLGRAVGGLEETNRMIQTRLESVDLEGTVNSVTVTLNAMQLLLERMTQMMGQNQEQLRATMYNLRLTTESLKDFARSIEREPSRLLFDDPPDARELP